MQHPDCPNDPAMCQIARAHRVATALAWTPVYDGNGNLLTADPNTFVDDYECYYCRRVWQLRRTGTQVELLNFGRR